MPLLDIKTSIGKRFGTPDGMGVLKGMMLGYAVVVLDSGKEWIGSQRQLVSVTDINKLAKSLDLPTFDEE